jgi:hypothetical protein
LHNDTLLLYAVSFYLTGHPSFLSCNNCVATNTTTSTTTRMTKERQASRRRGHCNVHQ